MAISAGAAPDLCGGAIQTRRAGGAARHATPHAIYRPDNSGWWRHEEMAQGGTFYAGRNPLKMPENYAETRGLLRTGTHTNGGREQRNLLNNFGKSGELMGGFGSGRYGGRPTVECGLVLDLGRLIKQHNVMPGSHVSAALTWTRTRTGEKVASIGYEAQLADDGPRWIRLHYTANSKPMDYRVYLTTTPCNFGGVRWWWLCPSTGQRVAKLYLPPGGTVFAARKAYRIAYQTQRDAPIDGTHARQVKLYKKLGANYDYYEGWVPERPKGMHHKTYLRLAGKLEAAIEAHEQVFEIGALRILGKFHRLK